METFLPMLRALEEAGVRYVVVGGIAVILHGHTRLTFDLDVVVELEPANVVAALDALAGIGLRPRQPVSAHDFADVATREGWIRDKGMMVLALQDPDDWRRHADVFVREPFPFDELWAASKAVPLQGLTVRIASIEHLIAMKRNTGRSKDADDVRILEWIKN